MTTTATNNKRPLTLLLGLLILIAVVVNNPSSLKLLHNHLLSSPEQSSQSESQQDPIIATLTTLESFSFNAQGQLSSTLISPKVVLLQSENQHITTPNIHTYKYAEPTPNTPNMSPTSIEVWHIQAEQATFNQQLQTSLLEGHVKGTAIDLISDANNLAFTTPVLNVDHTNKLAYSNTGALINSPSGQAQSQSLQIELQSHRVTLKNKVTSQYVPTP